MHGERLVLVDDLEVVEDVRVVQLVVDALVEGQGLPPPLVTVPVYGRICTHKDGMCYLSFKNAEKYIHSDLLFPYVIGECPPTGRRSLISTHVGNHSWMHFPSSMYS